MRLGLRLDKRRFAGPPRRPTKPPYVDTNQQAGPSLLSYRIPGMVMPLRTAFTASSVREEKPVLLIRLLTW